jgi:hypothetical protein
MNETVGGAYVILLLKLRDHPPITGSFSLLPEGWPSAGFLLSLSPALHAKNIAPIMLLQ